jgi:threonine synthase
MRFASPRTHDRSLMTQSKPVFSSAALLSAIYDKPIVTNKSGIRFICVHLCTDAEAVDACVKFAQEHPLLVEPACGAALAVLYSKRLMPDRLIVVEVCDGSGVNVDLNLQITSCKNNNRPS